MKKNVDDQGFVDYEGIRSKNGGDLKKYLMLLENADLSKCNEKEQLAFWINAYNAHAIQFILNRPKLKKVSDDFNIFKEKFKVRKIELSLDEIENRVIRANKRRGGPIEGISLPNLNHRIHFALVCAAIDCPPLINRAYDPSTLDETLKENELRFVNSSKHLKIENDTVVISSLMKWYEEDFRGFGGTGVYLSSLTDPTLRPDADLIDQKLKTDFPAKVKYQYDWTLNSVLNKP
ncbi:MAG: DUF547 domain-containing protein [Elusimicrobiota bacterium]